MNNTHQQPVRPLAQWRLKRTDLFLLLPLIEHFIIFFSLSHFFSVAGFSINISLFCFYSFKCRLLSNQHLF